MDAALLDTDILSEVLKRRNSTVTAHAAAYLQTHGAFAFSAFTRLEIRRGYLLANATRELPRFELFCQHCLILPVTDGVLDRAAGLWAEARRGGHPHGDADLIIAATALEHGRVLVTGNTRHFGWVPGLTTADWRTP